MNRSVPEIITINSEALERTIRNILPSQNGFGSELQASNVITPIIDLTPTAEGSVLPTYLQTAFSYGSLSYNSVSNTSTTIQTGGGFYRLYGNITSQNLTAGVVDAGLRLTDGATPVSILQVASVPASTELQEQTTFDIYCFCRPEDSIIAISNNANSIINVASFQIATVTGELISPAGFTAE